MNERDELKRVVDRIEEVWNRAIGLRHDDASVEYFGEELKMALADARRIIGGVEVYSMVPAYREGSVQVPRPHQSAELRSVNGVWYWCWNEVRT